MTTCLQTPVSRTPSTRLAETRRKPPAGRPWAALPLLLALLFLSACDSTSYQEIVEVEIPGAIALHPATLQLEEGDGLSMTVVDTSRPRQPRVADDWISWSSADPGIVTVENGRVRAVSTGETQVTARVGAGMVATSTVRVTRTPTTLTVQDSTTLVGPVATRLSAPVEARVLSALGRPVAGAEVRFRVVGGTGRVSPVVAQTDAEGRVSTNWTLGFQSGPQKVIVEVLNTDLEPGFVEAEATPGPAHAVRVMPEDALIRPGMAFQFSAEVVDAFGNFVAPATADWTSSNAGVVAVQADGWVRGVAQGEALIEARPVPAAGTPATVFSDLAQSPGQGRGNARVRVSPDELGGDGTMAILGGNYQVGSVGQTLSQALTVRVTDGSGTPVRHQDVNWTVTSGSATLSQTTTRTNPHGQASVGLTLGSTPGQITVEASAPGVGSVLFQASAEVGPVAVVRLSPGTTALKKGESRAFEISASDQFGNPVSSFPAPAWTSANSAVASVSSQGVATGLSGGSTQVRASIDGVVGAAEVAVEADGTSGGGAQPTVASVTASPGHIAFTALGSEVQASVEARDAAGQRVSDVEFRWRSSNEGVATVNQAGRIVSRGLGTALIVVSAVCCETVAADTITLSVSQEPAQLVVAPGSLSLRSGESQRVSVTLRDSNGNVFTPTSPVAWASSNTRVARVAADGTVTAEVEGSATVTAAYGGLSSSVSVAVTAVDPPVVTSGHWANQPSRFSHVQTTTWPNGELEGWGIGSPTRSYTVPISGSPTGGTHALTHHYYEGQPSGAGFNAWRDVPRPANEIYIGTYLRYSGEFWGHSSGINKFMYLRTGPRDPSMMWFEAYGQADGRLHLYLVNQLAGCSTHGIRNSSVEFVRGRWHKVEIYMRLGSSPSAADGHITVWVDGQRAVDQSICTPASTESFQAVHLNGMLGGVGDPNPVRSLLQYDQVRVAVP